jgi:hypothetical protein
MHDEQINQGLIPRYGVVAAVSDASHHDATLRE